MLLPSETNDVKVKKSKKLQQQQAENATKVLNSLKIILLSQTL